MQNIPLNAFSSGTGVQNNNVIVSDKPELRIEEEEMKIPEKPYSQIQRRRGRQVQGQMKPKPMLLAARNNSLVNSDRDLYQNITDAITGILALEESKERQWENQTSTQIWLFFSSIINSSPFD